MSSVRTTISSILKATHRCSLRYDVLVQPSRVYDTRAVGQAGRPEASNEERRVKRRGKLDHFQDNCIDEVLLMGEDEEGALIDLSI